MKLLIVTLTLIVFSFTPKKDSFTDDFLSFKSSLDNYVNVIYNGGDSVRAKRDVKLSLAKLSTQEDRMEMERANKWDSFEYAWPNPPVNWRCHLNCVYQSYRCLKIIGESWEQCMGAYDYCAHECNE